MSSAPFSRPRNAGEIPDARIWFLHSTSSRARPPVNDPARVFTGVTSLRVWYPRRSSSVGRPHPLTSAVTVPTDSLRRSSLWSHLRRASQRGPTGHSWRITNKMVITISPISGSASTARSGSPPSNASSAPASALRILRRRSASLASPRANLWSARSNRESFFAFGAPPKRQRCLSMRFVRHSFALGP